MTTIDAAGNFCAISSRRKILIYWNGKIETKILEIPRDLVTLEENGPILKENESSEKKYRSKKEGIMDNYEHIVCIKISCCGRFLAAATYDKVLVIWNMNDHSVLRTQELSKRPIAISFTPNSVTVVVADKAGDVYHFPVKSINANIISDVVKGERSVQHKTMNENDHILEPILGHLSMLCDVMVTSDGKYIITCDRDEKIRVSSYPNAYNIHNFCLGHTEFVTGICSLPGKCQNIISYSGDGTIRIWDYCKGISLVEVDTRQHSKSLGRYFEKFVNSYKNLALPEDQIENNVQLDSLTKYENNKEKGEKIKTEIGNCPVIKSSKPVVDEGSRLNHNFPAIKLCKLTVCNRGTFMAVILDHIPGIILYQIISNSEVMHIKTLELGMEPYSLAWISSECLVVLQHSTEFPLIVFTLSSDGHHLVQDKGHPLLSLCSQHDTFLKDGQKDVLNTSGLYKQRYNNVADYMKKKDERLSSFKTAEKGLTPPLKKGRWCKK